MWKHIKRIFVDCNKAFSCYNENALFSFVLKVNKSGVGVIMYRKQNQLMEMAVCMIDAGMMLCCLLAAGMMRYRYIQLLFEAENVQTTCSVMMILHIASFYFLKVYEGFFKRGRYREMLLSIKHNVILIAGASLLGFGMKNEIFVSRLFMGYFFVLNTLAVWVQMEYAQRNQPPAGDDFRAASGDSAALRKLQGGWMACDRCRASG